LDITGTVTLKAVASAPGFLTSAPASASYKITAFAPTITTVAGTGRSGFSGAGGPALSASFAAPSGIAFDKAGNMYVADSPNNVIWMISASTGTASIYAGTGIWGYTGDGAAAINATLYQPRGLAFDSAGNLYIADTENDVIRKVTASTGIISTVAGGVPYAPPIGDGGPATSANLLRPSAIAFDGSGNLFIADTYNHRVRMVSATTGIITTVAGNGSATYSGEGGPATSAGLPQTYWIAVDKTGNIFIAAEKGIYKVTASSGRINAIAGFKDLNGNTGDGGPATSAEINPTAIALDSAGNLYVSNWPGEIREINSSTGVITRVAGIGFSGFSGDGGAAAVAQLAGPAQVAFDAVGNLYIADTYNYRIREVTFTTPTAATPAFSVPAGTYTTPQSVVLTDATPNSTIYYTIDGSAPSVSSNAYTTPITVSASITIKAIAIAAGYNQSAVASAAYVITLPPPTPSVTSMSPQLTSAGSAQFTLTVNGSGFTSASSVYWGTSALTTQFVSATQLTATVPASDLTAAGVVAITVQTPSATGSSNALQFEIDSAGSGTPPTFPTPSVTVTAGTTATYSVTLPASATNVSVRCLNLPAGAACSYSASTGMLTVTTTSSTPIGTYVITVAFTETLPGAAAAVLLLPFLLPPFAGKKRRNSNQLRLLAIITAIMVVAIAAGCGGGGGGGGTVNPPPPATHQVTSSATITLIVK
jgi:sugar lactone lactonase YvrE